MAGAAWLVEPASDGRHMLRREIAEMLINGFPVAILVGWQVSGTASSEVSCSVILIFMTGKKKGAPCKYPWSVQVT